MHGAYMVYAWICMVHVHVHAHAHAWSMHGLCTMVVSCEEPLRADDGSGDESRSLP